MKGLLLANASPPAREGRKDELALATGARQELFISTPRSREEVEGALRKAGGETP